MYNFEQLLITRIQFNFSLSHKKMLNIGDYTKLSMEMWTSVDYLIFTDMVYYTSLARNTEEPRGLLCSSKPLAVQKYTDK